MTPSLLAELLDRRARAEPVLLATRLSDGAQSLLPARDGAVAPASPALAEAATEALAAGVARLFEADDERWFLEPHLPAFRLLVVGAVHIAQMLAPIAAIAGFAVTVIDPRGRFATEERFPGVALRQDWPDEAMAALLPDRSTAVVVLTHDPKLDDPALEAALASDAFYLGALGSRRTHAARLRRLGEAGHAAASLARIRGPVGLALGAVSPGEIAVSILAEIIAARRGAALGRRD